MTPSITEAGLIALLRNFLVQIEPAGFEAVRGQANRVPETTAPNFAVIWPVQRIRLGTNVNSWAADTGATTMDHTTSMEVGIQIDFHGVGSADNAQVFAGLFRDSFGCNFFADSGARPLYTKDGLQVPFVNDSRQYEDRWVVIAMFDANITVTAPQEFATEVTIETNVLTPAGD